jgi:hypothetical protein
MYEWSLLIIAGSMLTQPMAEFGLWLKFIVMGSWLLLAWVCANV